MINNLGDQEETAFIHSLIHSFLLACKMWARISSKKLLAIIYANMNAKARRDEMRQNETKLSTHASDVIIASQHHSIIVSWIWFWLFTMSHNPLITWSCWRRMVACLSSKATTLHENQICIIHSIENVSNFIFVQNNVLSLKIDSTGMRIWSSNLTIRDNETKRRRDEEMKRWRDNETLHIFEILSRLSIKLYKLYKFYKLYKLCNLYNFCALIYLAYLW
jgi:hypothetical protein